MTMKNFVGCKAILFLVFAVFITVLNMNIMSCPQVGGKLDEVEKGGTDEADKESSPGYGVYSVYLDILKEAERRSAADFKSSHTRGNLGVVIGPTEGKFDRYTIKALQNGRRIRKILGDRTDIKLALMTSPDHLDILQKCQGTTRIPQHPDACRLWANGTVFDDVIATKSGLYKGNDNHTLLEQGSSNFWLKSLSSYIFAPYKQTIVLDSDAYPCPGFEKLFALSRPFSDRLWAMPMTNIVDLAIGLDQYPFGSGGPEQWIPGDKNVLTDWQYFGDRNTGTILFNFHRQLVHTFCHFVPLVSEHIYNNVATKKRKVINDQLPFRVALYLFERFHPEFHEEQIPMHTSCRCYPGWDRAGIDGFLNGMYPIQQDGTRCKECSCTPCLVNHNAGMHAVTINGTMGWED